MQAQSQSTNGSNSAQRLVIDVDCNNVINVAGAKSDDPVNALAFLLKKWSSFGAVIVPICDGSKQATHQHRAVRARASNNAILRRQELQEFNNRLENDLLNNTQRTQMLADRKKKRVKSAETQSFNVVPADLPSLLSDALEKLSGSTPHEVTRGYVESVKTSWFQADATMGGRYLSGKSQLLMSNDGDFPAFYGGDCISIKKVTGNKLSIQSSSMAALIRAKDCLSEKSQEKVKLHNPSNPFFESAVILGCDVWPGGVKDAGIVWMENALPGIQCLDEEVMYNKLLQLAIEKTSQKQPQITAEVITAFIHGVIYEPTNEDELNNQQQAGPTYITKKLPKTLCKYLQEF